MPTNKPLIIGLLSHYFEDANLGCVALSVSNVILMDQVAQSMGIPLEYRILVTEKHPDITLEFTQNPYVYRRYTGAKQTVRHPVRLLRTDIFDDCDLVTNINAGDGFTDLYGWGRVLTETYMSTLAQMRHKPVIMAPQTIGPFDHVISRRIASRVLSRCEQVYARDEQSTALARRLGALNTTIEVIDVAFALPFDKPDASRGDRPLSVGINVSGLLHRGGYNRDNYFNLSFEYRDFITLLVDRLSSEGCEIHLIPHVIAEAGTIEDDYSACEEVHKEHPETILAPRFEDPIEAKSYIAALDFFSGARMHSTIGAISSHVPVVPIGYSKKLKGLYDTLRYPYYIDAREDWTAESAVDQFIEWLRQRDQLRDAIEAGAEIVESRLELYRQGLEATFREALSRK